MSRSMFEGMIQPETTEISLDASFIIVAMHGMVKWLDAFDGEEGTPEYTKVEEAYEVLKKHLSLRGHTVQYL